MAIIMYRGKDGKLYPLVDSINVSGNGISSVHVGDEEPVDPDCKVWYDTSYLPTPLAKCKLPSGEWAVVAGGSGGGGNITNNAELTVTNETGWSAKTIAFGAECMLLVSWKSIENDKETGDGTIEITVGDKVKSSYDVKQGKLPPIDVSNYLVEGKNVITITITDTYGNSRFIRFTLMTVKIKLESFFDKGDLAGSKQFHKGNVTYTYVPHGYVEKNVHFILHKDDGTTQEIGNQLVEVTGEEQTFIIEERHLSHGSHLFEVYFDCNIDGMAAESDHLFYDIIWVDENNDKPIVACAYKPKSVKQYETLTIPWIAYDPLNNPTQVIIKDNFGYTTTRTADRTEQKLNYKATNTSAPTELSFYICDVDDEGNPTEKPLKTLSFSVSENILDVSAVSGLSLQLHLETKDRSNKDPNRDNRDWHFGNVTADLQNFNFGDTDGWVPDDYGDTVLRVTGDARVYIPFTMFEEDLRVEGKTIEFEFATRDVLNYDTPIIKCWSDEKGIEITAQKALLKSEKSDIFTQYKENEHIRVTFCIEKVSKYRLLSIYLNGVLSGVKQYADTDNFSQTSPVGISIGSNDCTIDLYCIRVYKGDLTRFQILDNWIADTQNIEKKIERYNRNKIFDKLRRITIDTIPKTLPYLVVQCPILPEGPDDEFECEGYYVDPIQEDKCFTFSGATIEKQGTSSMDYLVPNLKLKYKGDLIVNGEPLSENDGYKLREHSVPTRTFTYKADVASIEGANNLLLVCLYNDICPAKTPPQREVREDKCKVRQGIDGVPIVIFHDNGEEIKYIGKYNFNNDKSTPEVYGFDDGDECWSVEVNASDRVIYKNDDFSTDDWKGDFESRFPKKYYNKDKLQALVSWIKSTDRYQATGKNLTEITEPSIESITYNVTPTVTVTQSGVYKVKWSENPVTYTKDTLEYRLAKFRNEAHRIFNMDSLLFFYNFTTFFLMIDNWAKNTFPTYFEEDGLWYWLPYDFDTAMGINNEGHLVFGYWLEDTDMLDGGYVYNGQNSVLWNNVRDCFPEEIRAMYKDLRSKEKKLLYFEDIKDRFDTHQDKWGEAIFNEDMYLKHLVALYEYNNAEYLKMALGDKELQRDHWLYNRFRYYDSKHVAGDSLTDKITFRAWGSTTTGDAKTSIQMTPYADIYTCVEWASKTETQEDLQRTGRGKTAIHYCPLTTETLNDTEINIFSASQLSDIGDLSPLIIGGFNDFSCASKIRRLKIGDPRYPNGHLETLSLGNNTLLSELDVRNCYKLSGTINLRQCLNIEHIYCQDTVITGVDLPKGGILKTLHLPATVTGLEIIGHPQLSKFSMPSYSSLSSLNLEGINFTKIDEETGNSVIDVDTILEQMRVGSRLRLVGYEKTLNTAEEIFTLYNTKFKKFIGINDQGGNDPEKANIKGIIHCGAITSEDYKIMKSKDMYPYIEIDYSEMSAVVKFYREVEENGDVEELTSRTIVIGRYGKLINAKCLNPINDGTENAIDTPTKRETEYSKFVFKDWDIALSTTSIVENTEVNAVFDEFKKHKVTFKDDKGTIIQVMDKDGTLKDTVVYYNRDGENVITIPADLEDFPYTDEEGTAYMMYFKGWRNADTKVEGVLNINNNDYEEVEYEAVFTPERVYVISFIDPYNLAHSVTLYLEEGDEIRPNLPEPVILESDDGQFYHYFKGWTTDVGGNLDDQNKEDPKTVVGTEDITYYAVYNSELRSYEITIYGIVGGIEGTKQKILYQDMVYYGYDVPVPTSEDLAVVGYTFKEWDKPFVKVTGKETYTALYEIDKYTVKFVDWNGSLISEQKDVTYNTMPNVPNDPTRESTEQYHYRFVGWSPTPTNTTGDTVYKAEYSSIKRVVNTAYLSAVDSSNTTGSSLINGGEYISREFDPSFFVSDIETLPDFIFDTGVTSIPSNAIIERIIVSVECCMSSVMPLTHISMSVGTLNANVGNGVFSNVSNRAVLKTFLANHLEEITSYTTFAEEFTDVITIQQLNSSAMFISMRLEAGSDAGSKTASFKIKNVKAEIKYYVP